MELSTLGNVAEAEEQGRRIEFVDLNDEPLMDGDRPVGARIVGTHSKRFLSAQQKIAEREARRSGKKQTPAQRAANTKEAYAACILEWDFTDEGKMAPPLVVFEVRPDIYEQVIREANDHAGFLQPSTS